jgi:hypothetical protein
MSRRSWKVRVLIEEATLEVAFLFADQDVKREVNRVLQRLAAQEDPRSPSLASGLDVAELDEAPGWFRVKVARYGIRVIFRLLIVRNNRFLPVHRDKPLPELQEDDRHYIEVMQMGYRKDVYGRELRRRFWKYRREDD